MLLREADCPTQRCYTLHTPLLVTVRFDPQGRPSPTALPCKAAAGEGRRPSGRNPGNGAHQSHAARSDRSEPDFSSRHPAAAPHQRCCAVTRPRWGLKKERGPGLGARGTAWPRDYMSQERGVAARRLRSAAPRLARGRSGAGRRRRSRGRVGERARSPRGWDRRSDPHRRRGGREGREREGREGRGRKGKESGTGPTDPSLLFQGAEREALRGAGRRAEVPISSAFPGRGEAPSTGRGPRSQSAPRELSGPRSARCPLPC